MQPLPEIRDSNSKEELIQQCDEVSAALAAFVRSIPLEYLNSRGYPEGWTPAKNVRHVCNTVRLISRWLSAPGWVIRLAGKAPRRQPSIQSIRPTNRPAQYDYGTYKKTKPADPAQREELAQKVIQTFEGLKTSIDKRTEEEFESRKGMFGGMGLRLFTLFSIKHAVFHISVVRTRLLATGEAERSAV
ncbi:MAG: DinB family protein [Leptospiraceae bacterium]|nr:DinB family protein [Leptospiraceae bacterium]